MSAKFIRRTFRNVVLRNRPYFAHLAVTHRCNLRCRFCHIQDEKFEELDTGGFLRVIDVLDRLGVAVLSVSGGGEPLLRLDVAAILDYASRKGMYTKITSNATMPVERYRQLLASGVKEIAISLDGVEGNDLPYSHVGPRILQTVQYLHDHLPPGKQLTLNVTVTQRNCGHVDKIVDYCTKEFPNAKIWLNPVVVGSGKLRTETEPGAKPSYLGALQSPSLLSAKFYDAIAVTQFHNRVHDWGCKAGRMFFDVKPNGDFWICQDQPARTPLNLLDPGFFRKYRSSNFAYRKDCTGCTYSCYLVTQKGFEPRNWPQMAAMWWKANTNPGEPCRQVALKHGWFAGLLSYCMGRFVTSAMKPAAAACLLLALSAAFLSGQHLAAPLPPEQVLERMEQSNVSRNRTIASYRGLRRYEAANPRLGKQASVLAEVRSDAPGHWDSTIIARSGSGAVQRMVIRPLLAAERATALNRTRENVDICRRNYAFTFLRYDGNIEAYVFEARPLHQSKYLFRGAVWIDSENFGIRRIEGEPARSPSFWVKRTSFVHDYAQFGPFWFPHRHRSAAQLRLFGASTLTIEYLEHEWRTRDPAEEGNDQEVESSSPDLLGAAFRPPQR